MSRCNLNVSRLVLLFGLIFLYLPLFILVIYSFNASKLVTVWAGFSTKWYGELLQDDQLIDATLTTLDIGISAATVAVILGTLSAYLLNRFGKFWGRGLFSSMITAPLVMPDVILGLAMLLMFVSMATNFGWPEDRGMLTIWIAHVTFCTSYTTVVISSRLRTMDVSIEEAAMDLGATPLRTFCVVTLPMMAPALASAWLLSFTLSLDDLVISSFVSGPGSTTLPMVVFSAVRMGVSPEVNALATLMILCISLVAFVSWWLSRRSERISRDSYRMLGRDQ